ncbi:NAD(P)H-quinone oxidoreductase subunit 3 [Thalassoglobus neptunius]|uniref:NADH-quinone oxidoreductase subunit A n=1 Tax=Thalassoglobus neptunius TaxID=1938619 RepID=A0A5C5WIN9_9PLAN|nr:NADH-quinone oxidoreductase subunit A [Thalassoglobus neptunius]TWT49965.1 NAD(P)H-quinone oxidoreductase subunit 3 [Thalassoglobus neptunius]
MTDLLVHFILFIIAGAVLVAAPMLIGRLVRPNLPTPEKDAVYECGEPTIGSSYVQFDIRFYVVALLFIIFDVEVVFFFPWATVFGGVTQLADTRLTEAARTNLSDKLLNLEPGTTTAETAIAASDALRIAWTGFADILVFFGVLLVGFAYVWRRGDLDWVRAMVNQAKIARAQGRKNSQNEPRVDSQLAS